MTELDNTVGGDGQARELAIHERFEGLYNAFFDKHPDTDWVMIDDVTREILGGGTDDQLPSEDAFSALEGYLRHKVHMFGRPVEVGVDGSSPGQLGVIN